MEKERMETDLNKFENEENKKKNPNSIGELLSISKDLPTLPDKVYRCVHGMEAIDDLNECGFVRNKQSAGVIGESRWGERVFWSRGTEGKFHNVPQGGYIIEAPLSVAQEREVKREDVSAIYTKNENGEVFNMLKRTREQEAEKTESQLLKQENSDAEKLRKIREEIGVLE